MRKFLRLPTAGLNVSELPEMLDDSEAQVALNVRFRFGYVLNRPGAVFISDVGEKPLWFGRFCTDTGGLNTNFTLLLTNSFLYRLVGTVWTKIDTFDSNPLTGTGRFGVAMGGNRIFVSRKGAGFIQYWDGNTANPMVKLMDLSGLGGFSGNVVPGARFLEYFNFRLMLGYPTDNGPAGDQSTMVRWSSNGFTDRWDPATGAGFIDLSTGALGDELSEPISGIKSLAGRLAVYKRHAIMDLIPTGVSIPIFSSETRVRGIGNAAPYTLTSIGQAHFFLGDDNVYSWDGIQLRPTGNNIQRLLQMLVDTTMFLDYFGSSCIETQEFYLVLADGLTFVYDYVRNYWTRDNFPAVDPVFLSALGSADVGTLVMNWSGPPAPIPGTWLDHPEAWTDLNIAGTPALFGGGSGFPGTYGTFYLDPSLGVDYDNTLNPFQVVETKSLYYEDPSQLANIKRVMLKYGPNDGLANGLTITVTVLTVTGEQTSSVFIDTLTTPLDINGGYLWTDFNISGNPYAVAVAATGGTFQWLNLILEIETSGDQYPPPA